MRDNQRADQSLVLQGQQFQETRRANQFNQALAAGKEQRAATEQFRQQGKDAQNAIIDSENRFIARHTDKKTGIGPNIGPLKVFGEQLARSPTLQQFDKGMVSRLQDGGWNEADWEKVYQMQKMFEDSKPTFSFLGRPASADEIVQRYFQINTPQV